MNAVEWLKNLFSGKKVDTRVLVDLIFQASSFYALPVPSAKVDIGDFGSIDSKTGVFRKNGNLLEDFPDLELWLGKPHTSKEDRREFTARQTETKKQKGSAGATVVPLAGVKLEQGAEWEISSSRSAVLYLMKPAHTAYPFDGRLGDFLMWKTKDDPEKRKFYLKQVVVTKTYKAQSYAQFVSNGQTGKVKCEFKCKVPIPPGNVALSSDQVWETTTQSGTWSLGGYTKDQYSFTPLIELQSLEKKPSCPFVRPFEFTKDLVFESVYKHVRPSAEEDSPNPKEEGTVSYTDFAKDAVALKTQAAANASKPAAQTPDNRPSQGKLSLPINVSLQVPINISGGEEDEDGDQTANMSDDGGQQEPGVASGGAEPSPQQSEEQPCSDAQAPDDIPTQASSTSPESNGGGDNCANQSPPDDGAGQAPPTGQTCPDDQTTCPAPSESPGSGAGETDNGGGQSCPSDQDDPTPPADADNSDCNDQQNDCPPVGSPDEEPCEDLPSDMQAIPC